MFASVVKFATIALLFATIVCAQSIVIGAPPDGAAATAGQNVTVELDFPNSLTGVKHVSVVISLQSCTGQVCSASTAASAMGTPLYAGNYTPQYYEGGKPPYQNFTVTIPDGIQSGTNVLNVAHFMLLGASAQPILEFKNVSIVT